MAAGSKLIVNYYQLRFLTTHAIKFVHEKDEDEEEILLCVFEIGRAHV